MFSKETLGKYTVPLKESMFSKKENSPKKECPVLLFFVKKEEGNRLKLFSLTLFGFAPALTVNTPAAGVVVCASTVFPAAVNVFTSVSSLFPDAVSANKSAAKGVPYAASEVHFAVSVFT